MSKNRLYQAKFRYIPLNKNELALTPKEVIYVIEFDYARNEGWWKGQNSRGIIGVFPKSYVTPLPDKLSQPTQNTSKYSDDTPYRFPRPVGFVGINKNVQYTINKRKPVNNSIILAESHEGGFSQSTLEKQSTKAKINMIGTKIIESRQCLNMDNSVSALPVQSFKIKPAHEDEMISAAQRRSIIVPGRHDLSIKKSKSISQPELTPKKRITIKRNNANTEKNTLPKLQGELNSQVDARPMLKLRKSNPVMNSQLDTPSIETYECSDTLLMKSVTRMPEHKVTSKEVGLVNKLRSIHIRKSLSMNKIFQKSPAEISETLSLDNDKQMEYAFGISGDSIVSDVENVKNTTEVKKARIFKIPSIKPEKAATENKKVDKPSGRKSISLIPLRKSMTIKSNRNNNYIDTENKFGQEYSEHNMIIDDKEQSNIGEEIKTIKVSTEDSTKQTGDDKTSIENKIRRALSIPFNMKGKGLNDRELSKAKSCKNTGSKHITIKRVVDKRIKRNCIDFDNSELGKYKELFKEGPETTECVKPIGSKSIDYSSEFFEEVEQKGVISPPSGKFYGDKIKNLSSYGEDEIGEFLEDIFMDQYSDAIKKTSLRRGKEPTKSKSRDSSSKYKNVKGNQMEGKVSIKNFTIFPVNFGHKLRNIMGRGKEKADVQPTTELSIDECTDILQDISMKVKEHTINQTERSSPVEQILPAEKRMPEKVNMSSNSATVNLKKDIREVKRNDSKIKKLVGPIEENTVNEQKTNVYNDDTKRDCETNSKVALKKSPTLPQYKYKMESTIRSPNPIREGMCIENELEISSDTDGSEYIELRVLGPDDSFCFDSHEIPRRASAIMELVDNLSLATENPPENIAQNIITDLHTSDAMQELDSDAGVINDIYKNEIPINSLEREIHSQPAQDTKKMDNSKGVGLHREILGYTENIEKIEKIEKIKKIKNVELTNTCSKAQNTLENSNKKFRTFYETGLATPTSNNPEISCDLQIEDESLIMNICGSPVFGIERTKIRQVSSNTTNKYARSTSSSYTADVVSVKSKKEKSAQKVYANQKIIEKYKKRIAKQREGKKNIKKSQTEVVQNTDTSNYSFSTNVKLAADHIIASNKPIFNDIQICENNCDHKKTSTLTLLDNDEKQKSGRNSFNVVNTIRNEDFVECGCSNYIYMKEYRNLLKNSHLDDIFNRSLDLQFSVVKRLESKNNSQILPSQAQVKKKTQKAVINEASIEKYRRASSSKPINLSDPRMISEYEIQPKFIGIVGSNQENVDEKNAYSSKLESDSSDSGFLVKEGWLDRKTNYLPIDVWRTRFFKLYNNGSLHYFKRALDTTPIGIIELANCKVSVMNLEHVNNRLAILLTSKRKRLILSHDYKSIIYDWLRILTKATIKYGSVKLKSNHIKTITLTEAAELIRKGLYLNKNKYNIVESDATNINKNNVTGSFSGNNIHRPPNDHLISKALQKSYPRLELLFMKSRTSQPQPLQTRTTNIGNTINMTKSLPVAAQMARSSGLWQS
ncbi:hypothetical protein AX774_g7636 [Zancudomyces culisetae]|uniref:Uncharacterized protein n=1 Tax=Zancudomyces culisetae TaxID=1213189 RepID=A0A1R1PDE7_ZANCU|nr:hypothetical protein AX774_g7636 [Zancudomyces culisetae]|eukprot:OMH78953.1 hypothetical protein AX774_g7636 [Zancudomyces culisetae]